ncbi:MAG TPA: glucose-6-phosphate dehydrogenase assembly protein OpcA [Ktedonobacterales bacterium]|nr:glucose-6-phosphate dehydrogenase assembly protein OpcA [Ktedonobacterales bacterium]
MTQTAGLTENMRQVEPDAIESELDNAWRAENAAVLAAGGHAGTRSSVLTLVAYATNETSAERTLRAIRRLTTQHPSRSIIVNPVAQTPTGRPLEAFINTRAITANGATGYGEEVILCATQSASQHLAGSILPLIVSGLPSFLWWEGVPPWNTDIFEATLDGFDRALFDTAEMPQVEQNLLALEDLVRRKKTSVAVSDFNFTRLSPWRELIAQFFDPEEHRVYLNGIERVTIEYAAAVEDGPVNTAQAYLFAGWLASRLGWRPVGGTAERLIDGQREHTLLDTSGRKITLELNARYGAPLGSWLNIAAESESAQMQRPLVGPGALMSVYLRAQANGAVASFAAAREADLRHASTHCQVPQGAIPSQTVHLPTLGEQSSLGDELLQLGHDPLFENALAAIVPALDPGLRRVRR